MDHLVKKEKHVRFMHLSWFYITRQCLQSTHILCELDSDNLGLKSE